MTVHLKKPLAEGLPLWLCFGLFGKRSQVAQVTSNLLCGRNSPELQTLPPHLPKRCGYRRVLPHLALWIVVRKDKLNGVCTVSKRSHSPSAGMARTPILSTYSNTFLSFCHCVFPQHRSPRLYQLCAVSRISEMEPVVKNRTSATPGGWSPSLSACIWPQGPPSTWDHAAERDMDEEGPTLYLH